MGVKLKNLFVILAAFCILFISMPARADTETEYLVVEDQVVVYGQSHTVDIETCEGTVNFNWKITDYDSGTRVNFTAMEGEEMIDVEHNLEEYYGSFDCDESTYRFLWHNWGDGDPFTLSYNIAYPKCVDDPCPCNNAMIFLGSFGILTLFMIAVYIKKRR